MSLRLLWMVLCVGSLLPVAGRAELLGYEGFNYPASGSPSLSGLNGGIGWSNGWVNAAGSGGVVSGNSLILGSAGTTGFDARSLGNSAFVGNARRAGRFLDRSANGNFGSHGYLDGNGRIGANGKTLYVSFLQQPNVTTLFYEFEFHRGDLGDPGRIAGIGNDFNSTTVNFRAPNSKQTPLGLGNTNVNFYVVRIDFKAGNDDVYVYRNPTENVEAENEPVLTMLAVSDLSFDGLSLAAFVGTTTVRHDEIRLGETWGDVLGGPPVFVRQPTNHLGFVGQSVLLTAAAESRQAVKYQWYREGAPLLDQTNATLPLPNLQWASAGNYWAVATNSLGVATSSVATVLVQVMALSSAEQNVAVGAGSNLLLNVSAAGALPMSFQWLKDGVALAGQTNAGLAIPNATVFAAGHYSLVASNPYGVVTSTVVNVYANLGTLLAYEGFDYPQGSGNLTGQAGGMGWSGAWGNVDGISANVISESLVGSNTPPGYDLHSVGNATLQPNATRTGRYLDRSATSALALRGYVDANGNIGAEGKTLYVSFLQQPDGTTLFYEFEFHRGSLGDAGRIAGIGNDLGAATVNFRAPNGSQSSLGAGSTNVNLYVVKIVFKAGNDDVYVYRNPTGVDEAANAPVLTMLGAGDMSFSGISFGAFLNNQTVKHDEIRLATTWADGIGGTTASLQLAERNEGNSRIRIAGSPGYAFQLQGARTVAGPWTNVARVFSPVLGVGEVMETNVWEAQRFYRTQAEPTLPAPQSDDVILANFEGSTYGTWVATGTAFGSGPAPGTLPNQNPVSGYQGARLVNSYYGTDVSTGTLTSAEFQIVAPYINFLIGGGNHPGTTCINLLVAGQVVRTATGANTEQLSLAQWDVSAFLGQLARLQILDLATDSWGHISIDQIVQTEIALPALTRQITVTNDFLNLPVKNGGAMRRVSVVVGGKTVRDFDIELADDAPDWWAFTDLTPFQGQTATISVNSRLPGSVGLGLIVQSNGIVGSENLYRESLRPQIHFSARRGWVNDANAVFFYQGEYHLYYQHNPYGWNWGNMHWGHAVSPDMVRWQELSEGIYPYAYQDHVFSGSAVIDGANTSGFKTGTNDVIVAAFTSTGRGECIAFSNDRGRTFTDYTNNPVVVHNGRDPRLLWYAPSNYWVMAVYDESGVQGINFYSSPNLREWTYRSRITGFFECPDFFPLPVDGQTNNAKWVLYDASSGYMLGTFNGVTFTPETAKLPGNSGAAFYAAQTFSQMPVGDARRVRIGWAQISLPGMPFNQLMYFPTELTLRALPEGVRLCAQPVAEIANLSANDYAWTNLSLSPGNNPLSGIRGTLFNVRAQFTPGTAQAITFTFQGLTVVYDAVAQQISCNGKTNPLAPVGGVVQLQILVDRDSIEIFGNNGQLYMPLPASNPVGNSLISLSGTGGTATLNFLTVSKLKSAWEQP